MLEIAGFLLSGATLASAAVHDQRSREVDDIHWAVVAGVGSVLASASDQMGIGQGASFCILAASLLLTAYMLSGELSGTRAIPVVSTAEVLYLMAYRISGSATVFASPSLFALFASMYWFRILRGGADVKAMMSLALAYPFGIFPLSVLFLATILSMLYMVPVMRRNGWRMSTTFEVPLSEAVNMHVWPVEDVVGGKIIRVPVPDDPGEVYARLSSHGCESVRVTPMVPFIVPIAAAFLIILSIQLGLIGNPCLWGVFMKCI
ncbi:MAG: hypothetical protein IJ469_05780 [Candidatus Methanomethylophilaceae archaeon]|nr:hypothetical protein [Candidatus Methanomethylophilaceae archaeon]